MAEPGCAAPPEHLVDNAPLEADSWTQRLRNKTHNIAALLSKLKGSKTVRTNYRAMVDLNLKKVVIACVLYWATISCSNMTTGQCQHDDRCLKRVPTSAKRLPPKQQRVIDRFIALFVATSGVPYSVCKNKWLKRAFAEAGASTLSPKRLKTTLNTLYEEMRMEKDAELKDQLQAGESVMLCTDGWRHRRAGHAHPLLNLVLLKPSSGCYFYDCFPLDKGAKKTAQFYADMHESLAMKVTGGDPRLLLGVIMDSPSTNRAALRLLERKYPSWICMTCCVHAMNLICKDMANENKTAAKHTAVGGFLKQVQHISKVLSDCDKISNALQVHQTATFGDVREVATHCATRFAILHKICRDLQRSKAALCDMVTSGAWETLKSASVNSSVLEEMKSPAAERNWSMWSLTYSNALRNNLGVETAKRDIYLKANVKEMDEKRDNMAPPLETLINILA